MKPAHAIAVGGFLATVLLGCNGPKATDEPQAKPAGGPVVFECRYCLGTIEIDGVITEGPWKKAQVIDAFTVHWQNRKAKTATKARLMWDAQYLYFCAEMEDTDLYADVRQPNGRTWENDVFELFFKPDPKKLAYYEFQVNAANTPLELFFPSRGSGGWQRFAPLTKINLESEVKLYGTLNDWTDKDQGWVVEGRIPWESFKPTGGRPKAGDRWKFSLCRYDYSTAFERPELSSCSPLTVSDFHRYEDYAELVFKDRNE